MKKESVLCYSPAISGIQVKEGFTQVAHVPDGLFNLENACIVPRPLCGDDPSKESVDDPDFIQIIPYVFVKHEGKFLAYNRSKEAETRLDGLLTLGFGGHINLEDYAQYNSGFQKRGVMDWIKVAAARELSEELCIQNGTKDNSDLTYFQESCSFESLDFVGLVRYVGDEVGKVHLGVCFIASFSPHTISSIERGRKIVMRETGEDVYFLSKEEIKATLHQTNLEKWSKIALSDILGESV